jgi:hypothetical protein
MERFPSPISVRRQCHIGLPLPFVGKKKPINDESERWILNAGLSGQCALPHPELLSVMLDVLPHDESTEYVDA